MPIMRKSYLITAGAVTAVAALTVLVACTYDSPKATSLGTPVASGATLPASLPPGATAAAPTPGVTGIPGAPGAPAPNGPAGGTTGQPPNIPDQHTTTPSRPAGIPKPQLNRNVGWVNATVTLGGSGPCYTLKGTDGVVYATYSGSGVQLPSGSRVRAQLTPGKTPVNCGSGQPARMDRVQLAG